MGRVEGTTSVGRCISFGMCRVVMGLATIGLVLPVLALEGVGSPVAPSDSKIKADLLEEMAGIPADQLIPVTIVMRDRAPQNQIAAAKQIRDKGTRRQAVIALLKDAASLSQRGVLEELHAGQATGAVGTLIRPLWISNVIGAEVTAGMVRSIAQRGDVDYINHDKPLGAEVFPVEPAGDPPVETSAIECGVRVMQAPRVWDELGITGRGSIVCSIDTGCCITHRDLENQIWVNTGEIPGNGIDDDNNGYIDDVNGWNFWERDGNIADRNGHGTHVAGTVLGDGTEGQQTGMAPDALMMTARYFVSFSGESTIWESMEYAVDNGAHIITVSSGWPHNQNPDRRTWREVCETTIAAGLVVIYAAGNEGGGRAPDNVRTPADVPAVISVGATDCNDNIASFSSRGPITWQNIDPWRDWPFPPGKIKPTISAPGVGTLSTAVCSGYRSLSGTSMATPHVAGAVALMLEGNPNLDHDQVKQILMDTSIDLGAEGMDNNYGAGRVDAYLAVQMAIAMNNRFPADSFEVTRGELVSGGVQELSNGDDNYVRVNAIRPDEAAAASVEVVVTGHVDIAAPGELIFTFEGATSGAPTRQRVELFNYTTDEWVQWDERDGPMTDTPITVSISVNADDYVEAGTLEVKARIGYHDRGVSFVGWAGRYDATFWETVE